MATSEVSSSTGRAPANDQTQLTHLILVRHGETEANVNQVWQGDLDAPLTPRGLLQVSATATRLADLHATAPADLLYVSPLPRAQSTAAAISGSIGLPVVIEDRLREFALGDWEGRSLRELRERENLWVRWDADPAFAPPNGESPISFNRRATQALATLVARHPGQRLLAVTHGAFISSVLATWLGGDARNWRSFDPPNCAITLLAFDGQQWVGELVNDISHLPPEAQVDYEAEY